MKRALLLTSFLLFVPICNAQTAAQLEECHKAVEKAADPVIPPSICAVTLGDLRPDEHVVTVDDVGVMTLTGGIIHDHPLPPRLETAINLEKVRRTVAEDEQVMKGESTPNDSQAGMLVSIKEQWATIRDSYCYFHPGDTYLDLTGSQQICPGKGPGGAESADSSNIAVTDSGPQSSPFNVQGTKKCQKAITFARAQNGGLAYRLPSVSSKWLDKAQKKYYNVCFLQYGAQSGQENYLIVLSSSSSAYVGLQPVFHRATTIEPVSGSGIVTDGVGGTWDFTYQGTATTTTRTQENVPYTDTNADFYANAYGGDGSLVATSERSASSRQGGDPSNALGYNLTSALLSIHLKEHLLDSIVKKVSSLP